MGNVKLNIKQKFLILTSFKSSLYFLLSSVFAVSQGNMEDFKEYSRSVAYATGDDIKKIQREISFTKTKEPGVETVITSGSK